jgi:hypothetical protein
MPDFFKHPNPRQHKNGKKWGFVVYWRGAFFGDILEITANL